MKKCRKGSFSKIDFLNLMFRDLLPACMYALPTETRRGHGIPRNWSHQSSTGPEDWTRSSGRTASAPNSSPQKGELSHTVGGISVLQKLYKTIWNSKICIYHVIQLSPLLSTGLKELKSANQGLCSCAVAALLTRPKIWDPPRYLSGHKESQCDT